LAKKKLVFALGLVLVFCFSMIPFMISDVSAQVTLPGWDYRKYHIITGSAGAGLGYQMRLLVHYGVGVDNGEDVYCNSHCKIDFGDIRFTELDGVTQLSYWMQEKIDGDYAVFWVKINADLSASDVIIYIYYGNLAASTTSNGDDTFLAFDDFGDSGFTDEWSPARSSPSWSQSGGELRHTSSISDSIFYMSKTPSADFAIETRMRVGSSSWWGAVAYRFNEKANYWQSSVVDGFRFLIGNEGDVDRITRFDNGQQTVLKEISRPDYTDYHTFSIRIQGTSHRVYRDDLLWLSTYDGNYNSANYWGFIARENSQLTIDWVVLRKYVSPEPAHVLWSMEETGSWLNGFSYRKLHVINGSIGAGANYQIKFTVHYSSGNDSGENMYCNGLCRADFGDIRFTSDDGVTLLDYWIQEKTDGDNATFWVEVADSLDASAIIYVYFGNPGTTTISEGEETFIFFDDFSGASLDSNKWDQNTVGVIFGELHNGFFFIDCMKGSSDNWIYNGTDTGNQHQAKGFTLPPDFKVLFTTTISNFNAEQMGQAGVALVAPDNTIIAYACHYDGGSLFYDNRRVIIGENEPFNIKSNWSVPGGYPNILYKDVSNFDTASWVIRKNDTTISVSDETGGYICDLLISSSVSKIALTAGGWTSPWLTYILVNYVAVAKSILPEPAHGLWQQTLPVGNPDINLPLILGLVILVIAAVGVAAYLTMGVNRTISPRE
jgi:hypothetical protein